MTSEKIYTYSTGKILLSGRVMVHIPGVNTILSGCFTHLLDPRIGMGHVFWKSFSNLIGRFKSSVLPKAKFFSILTLNCIQVRGKNLIHEKLERFKIFLGGSKVPTEKSPNPKEKFNSAQFFINYRPSKIEGMFRYFSPT